MSSQNERVRISDVILAENLQEQGWCREAGTLSQDAAATADLEIGTVLEDDTGDYVVCTTGANANAILLKFVTKEELIDGDVENVPLLVRGPALVKPDGLTITTGQETTALAALAALLIETRDEPDTYEEGIDTA